MRIWHYYNKTLVVINELLLHHSRDVEIWSKAGKIGRSFLKRFLPVCLWGSEKWE